MAVNRPPESAITRRAISTLPEIVEGQSWRQVLRAVPEQREWLERVQVELTEIPAPTFQESARAQYIAERFRELGVERVRLDEAGNVLGERPSSNGNLVAVTAHLDTVAPPGVPITVRRNNGRLFAPGISDTRAHEIEPSLVCLVGTLVKPRIVWIPIL